MGFSTVAKNQALDAITVDRVQLHSGDPGSAGLNNAIAATYVAAAFDAASGGERLLSAAIDYTGLTPSQSITWFSVWLNAGTVFKGRGQITTGDVAANAAGEYQLTTAAKLSLTDS